MKKHNKKLITLMLAGLCAVSLGASVTASKMAQADETPTEKTASSYAISDVFSTTGTSGDDNGTVAFTLGNGEYARLKRDLALKWYDEGVAQYLNIEFAFKTLDFNSVTLEIESTSSVATEDGKVVNAVKFTVEGETVYATVINGKTEAKKYPTAIEAGSIVKLSLFEGSSFGSFGVKLNDATIGEFTTIGANYADYDSSKMYPFEFSAAASEEKEAVILLKEINGQRFDNVVDSKITDTAAPVLVVNEELNGFQYGTQFSLSYEKIDVLQSTSALSEEKTYYQYNPADAGISYEKKLTTSTYLMDTVYYTNGTDNVKEKPEGEAGAGYWATSVLAEHGEEYISIKITLGDSTFDGTKNADGTIPYEMKTYDLAWYATRVKTDLPPVGEDTATYLIIDENDEGPEYAYIKADEATQTNVYVNEAEFKAQVEAYQNSINAKIDKDKPLAGSNSEFALPGALDWLIKDNGGYRALKFTICYRTPSPGSGKTASNLAYNNLEIPTTEEGLYEFKVFATDKAGNSMKYYVDGKLVSVTSSNIWDIDEIPSFRFKIDNQSIEVEEKTTNTSTKKTEKKLDETFTLSNWTILGATNQKSNYALYRFDESKGGLTIEEDKLEAALISVSFKTIRTEAFENLDKVGKDGEYKTYIELYLSIYVSELAKELGCSEASLAKCFVSISEYNENITENDPEWEEYNKYEWDASSKSFKAVEEGIYFVFGDFYEEALPMQRAAAYHVVLVDTKTDTIEGESKVWAWVKNNVVSVVLFGVAAVMLILIILLLLVKPSDETLEDVDKEVEKKGKKENKKEDE